ncbi:hypothetical protein [Mucilaginibacter glaciei]|uniref:Uncharacterized protein n=1 Tax=Mucilaginibacter glaciei TaxID=2772109 RepID=A0A926S1H4_9SPHI|nr:hypothetical protein [Mucilaginibacter glaciei]MBD1393083.1 hypothetical protein [Mucilaginibacter glaciei]
MNLQFIHDNKGNTTGVFIPIEEWQTLKEKYAELQTEEAVSTIELASWQTYIIDQRLADYYTNQTDIEDFDNMLNDIEKSL